MLITPISEICDRFSIVRLKIERIKENNSQLLEEFKLLKNEINVYKSNSNMFKEGWLEELYKINGQIWDLESDIRRGKERELGLEEVGRRAIAIRDLNKKRIEIKNKISQETKSGFPENKIDHASA